MAHTAIPFGKFGPKIDPRGGIAISRNLCTCGRRDHLIDVIGMTYEDRTCGGWMLQVRHFNGEQHPDIHAANVYMVERDS